jgi:hypothetical protein
LKVEDQLKHSSNGEFQHVPASDAGNRADEYQRRRAGEQHTTGSSKVCKPAGPEDAITLGKIVGTQSMIERLE